MPAASDFSAAEKDRLAQINRQESYFLLSLATMKSVKKGKDRDLLLDAIERVGFLRKLTSYYFNQIDYLEEAVDLLTGRKTAEQTTRKISEICDKYAKSSELVDSIRNIGKNARLGYYDWSMIRYFMYEYEQELKKNSKTNRELLAWASKSDYEFDHKTIEHIYPQRAHDPYWQAKFSHYSVKQRNSLRNSLGNLLPISHGKNSSLSNKSFDTKKGSATNQIGYRYGCLSEIQVSMCDDWDAKEILRRGIYLLDFMERRWKINIGDVHQKISALGLEFVLDIEKITAEDLSSKPEKIPAKLIKLASTNA